MFPLVEFPELLQHYAPYFEKVFSAEAFIQFKRYISGLIVVELGALDQCGLGTGPVVAPNYGTAPPRPLRGLNQRASER